MSSTICMYVAPLLVQDNTHRIAFQAGASFDLIAVVGCSAQPHVAIKTKLAIGIGVDTGVRVKYALNENALEAALLLLPESFQQRCHLLPGCGLLKDNPHNLFAAIAYRAIKHSIIKRAFLQSPQLLHRARRERRGWLRRRRCRYYWSNNRTLWLWIPYTRGCGLRLRSRRLYRGWRYCRPALCACKT